MKTALKLMISGLLLVALPASATRFRAPLSLATNQCGAGRCYPTAYFDTNRSGAYYSDWACSTRTYNQHDGVDYGIGGFAAMDQGRWVVSAASGTVIAAHDGEFDRCTSANCGTANYIQIRHADGKVSWYWHLKRWSIRVRVGQVVPCGMVIALVGSSGYSTGPHLHFGVQEANGVMDDPYAASGQCGGPISYWVQQGPYGGLPGYTCE
jgi:murein DD-endopeptidase MepM/ murein hydrolase activator NlpD